MVGRTAVITGGGSGIGRASCHAFGRAGAQVVVADLNEESAQRVAAEITQFGGSSIAVRTDVSQESDVAHLFDVIGAEYGTVHTLVNNAAITDAKAHTADIHLFDIDVATWDEIYAVNIRGHMLMAKYAVPFMIDGGSGSIIGVSSNLALAGDRIQPAYSSSKGAVVSFALHLATEFGKRGIRSNCISPGAIRTPAFDSGVSAEIADLLTANNLVDRLGRPEDIASLALFLSSDAASFLTGLVIRCDGGQLSHLPHFAAMNELGLKTIHSDESDVRSEL
jgi:NAD(P)-dependent dehydrogenase (short-subunit alcohol dehydrogenase family)